MYYYVYITSNSKNNVIYIGVTNNLQRRMYEHKTSIFNGFTKRYHVDKLVYCERYEDPDTAIRREKNLKGWKRDKKNALIESSNPSWEEISCL
jgi:putative endonuclease